MALMSETKSMTQVTHAMGNVTTPVMSGAISKFHFCQCNVNVPFVSVAMPMLSGSSFYMFTVPSRYVALLSVARSMFNFCQWQGQCYTSVNGNGNVTLLAVVISMLHFCHLQCHYPSHVKDTCRYCLNQGRCNGTTLAISVTLSMFHFCQGQCQCSTSVKSTVNILSLSGAMSMHHFCEGQYQCSTFVRGNGNAPIMSVAKLVYYSV